jgi:RHS repeat-associated protein
MVNNQIVTFTVAANQTKTLQAYAYVGGTDSIVHGADYTFEHECAGQALMAPAATYPLDNEGHLPMAPELVGTITYTLDKAGNRTAVNGVNYSPNSINQYTSVGGSAVTNGDDHGIQVYGGFTYAYMRDQELTRISAPGLTYDVAYDALGRCVKRTANGAAIYYIYDGDKPILEYNANNGLVGFNVYGKGIDEIIERGAYGADNQWHWYFLNQDHEGSVTHLTDGSGNIIERYRYDAFGAPSIYAPNWTQRTASSYNNRFLFTGREYLGAWVYDYRARVYHSALGRFMSEDPKLFDAGDYNLFRYCHDDPLDFTDPMGAVTDARQEDPWYGHSQQAEALDKLAATRELLGLSSTYIRAALSAREGLTMGHVSQAEGNMYSYSLKPQYNIGDLSGIRGYQYVWNSNENCNGQCLTTVQHLSGAPSSTTPLLRGNPVGPNTKQGIAIATGYRYVNGQWIYPSKPPRDFKPSERINRTSFYVAPIGRGLMQTLEAQHGIAIHLSHPQPMEGWYELTSRLAPSATSTSQLHSAGGLYGPFY